MQDAIETQWWGHSKEHGWVVLDRTIPSNAPGIKDDLLFVRCRDTKTISVKREGWRPPSYRFAPNYIRDLAAPEADAATAELDGLKARWPEFEGEIQRECRETEERAEAARVQEEKEKKRAASEKRKLTAAAKA
jgi:hypothetical protein